MMRLKGMNWAGRLWLLQNRVGQFRLRNWETSGKSCI
jgi:hypothetical protein